MDLLASPKASYQIRLAPNHAKQNCTHALRSFSASMVLIQSPCLSRIMSRIR